ncbi:MAG: peptide MFS transporter [Polyangiales bacterium]
MQPTDASVPHGRALLGHPRGLFVLFLTEMWERMSYYGMRALLVLYMTSHLFVSDGVAERVLGFGSIASLLADPSEAHFADHLASRVYGLYTGFVYFTPFFGGLLADRWLGPRRSVLLGGTLMMIGHFLMAFEALFFVALVFLVLGNGAFKPNISSQVGSLYAEGDPKRDQAFTLFYVGINLGAMLAPLVCGTLGQTLGWHFGFGAAGVGMFLGLLVYGFGERHVRPIAPVHHEDGGVAKRTPAEERRIVTALVTVSLISLVFWAAYEQQGNTLQLWADRQTDWHVLGLSIPSTWYQSMNPLLILVLTPLLGAYWDARRAKGKEPTTIGKMVLGCFFLALGYVVMIVAARAVPDGARGSILWLAFSTFFLTVGELYLSPIGLSLISRSAPRRMVGTLMGVWFLASFFGNTLAGQLGTLYSDMPKELFFAMLGALAMGAGLAIAIVKRPLERALAGA